MKEYVDKQREYFLSGATLSYEFRKEQLTKLRKSLIDNKTLIDEAFKQDFNKCSFDVLTTEFAMVIEEIDYFLKHLKGLMKAKRVKASLVNFPAHGKIYHDPYGVVLVMAPWNYPLQLSLIPLVDAIACGNTCFVKPSNYSLNVSNAIEKVLSIFDEKYIKVILGGREKNQELLDQNFDFIFFTGGDKVGRIVLEKASKNLTPVVLELGGKSPCIVCKDTNIEMAAKRIVWGKYMNAGQTCVAPDYILIDKSIKNEFINKCKEWISKFYYKDGVISEDFPHIINDKHVERLSGLIDNNKVVCGAKINGRLIEPTIMDNVSFDDAIMQEEIFGPIMPIIEYDNLDEVVYNINSGEHSLALYLFTFDKNIIKKVMNGCRFGGSCINDCLMHLTNDNLPFGGVGRSGMGSYHGKKSFETFSHYKSVLVKGKAEMNIKYPPYNEGKVKIINKLFRIK